MLQLLLNMQVKNSSRSFLAPKDKYPAFPESFGQDRRTPWVELPKNRRNY